MAFAFLFIPSVIFWGSGFMKDTFTLSCIGLVTHFVYLIFYENKRIVANTAAALFFLYLIFMIKSYIVMAFLPAAFLWGVGLLSYKKDKVFKGRRVQSGVRRSRYYSFDVSNGHTFGSA